MSNYTTQLRWWCEQKTGLKSQPYADVISAARPLLFNFSYPIFEESYRETLETKIIKHFYMREIGAETFGLFQMWLDEKMNVVMPVANKKYEAFFTKFNFLDTDDAEENETGSENASASSTGTNTGKAVNKQSDTPQGTITNLEDGRYLSSAEIGETNSSVTGDSNSEASRTTTRIYKGRKGISPAYLYKEFNETIINVDEWVFKQLEELFMQIW